MGIRLNSDFSDMLRALSAERVRYLVIGGYAAIEHTEPRYTKDLDLWVEPTHQNAERVLRALRRFGAPTKNLSAKDLVDPDLVYQVGVEPVRIDFLMSLAGCRFPDAWKERVRRRWGGINVAVISARHLLANKLAVGRPQDLVDAERLRARGVRTAQRRGTGSDGARRSRR